MGTGETHLHGTAVAGMAAGMFLGDATPVDKVLGDDHRHERYICFDYQGIYCYF